MKLSPIRRKRVWFCVTVGGLAGVTALAAVGVAGGLTGRDATADASAAAQRQARPAAVAQDGKGDDKAHSKEKEVRCDPDRLIAALVRANADGPATLSLAKKCTYTLTANQDGNGLPLILQRIAIKGNGATIVRAANADDFRIFEVGFGGNLKLTDLTVKGGIGTTTTAGGTGTGGGGLLVQKGGRATIQGATFTFNLSTRDGGAIANYGTVKITGGDEQYKADDRNDSNKQGSDKQWTEDDWTSKDATYTSIDNNSAQGLFGGGGVFNDGSLTAEYTRLSYNQSLTSDGGGLTNHDGVSSLRNLRIDHNNTAQDGGGVSIQGGTTTLDYSYVTDNTSGIDGGGIINIFAFTQPTLYLRHTTVRHNFAGSEGGGVFNGNANVIVDRSRINENTSIGDGGGLDSLGSSAEAIVRHTDVNRNRAIGTTAQGGGIENTLGRMTLTDTNVIGNLSVLAPGGVENNGGEVLVDDDSTIIKNRPTNCEGATTPTIPNCFG